ncbi:MAG: ComF family protein [Dehalobacterium sp.]
MRQIFADCWQALLNLIFPTCRCIYCGQESILNSAGLCHNCQSDLENGKRDFKSCATCPIFIPVKERYCINCRRGKEHWFSAAIAVFPYQGEIREVIHDFKYRGAVKWARLLGSLMGEAVGKDRRFHDINMVIPVPLYESRKKMRGYNQSELLAKEIGRGLGLPVTVDNLTRIKDTPSQTGLDKEGRRENLVNAFETLESSKLQGKNILLVDDIYTTGATVETCSRILKIGGAKSVFVVTCAAGKRY